MVANYDIKKEEALFRDTNGFGIAEPIRLKSLLLKLKVVTLFQPLSDHFSGMSIKAPEFSFMLINSNHSVGRQHFTILHELYHLVVQIDFATMVCSTGKFDRKDKIEYHADAFAAYVLMPEQGILERMPNHELRKNKISLGTILEIEQYYSCSRSALLNRLREMGLIDVTLCEEFRRNVITYARGYGYDISLYQPGNDGLIIGDYGKKARELFEKEHISESHFISLMHDIGVDLDSEDVYSDEC